MNSLLKLSLIIIRKDKTPNYRYKKLFKQDKGTLVKEKQVMIIILLKNYFLHLIGSQTLFQLTKRLNK